jgi:hypothetical protein
MRCKTSARTCRGLRAGVADPHTLLIVTARRGCAVRSRQSEEPGTAPGRAGDGASDGREARIGPALPVEAIRNDSDGMALALIVANEHRAGLEVAPARGGVPGKALQQAQAFPIKAAECPLLQPESKHSPEQVLAQGRKRGSSERCPPAPPKGIDAKRPNARDLGLDRGRVAPALAHGYALG